MVAHYKTWFIVESVELIESCLKICSSARSHWEKIITELSQDPDHVPGTMGEAAVCVQNASKAYGIGKRRSNVLNSLNLIVKNGTM